MASAAYTHVISEMELPAQLMGADDVRALEGLPGWRLVLASIDAHKERLLAQLLNPTAKPDAVDRLRGEIRGLDSAREAADTIVQFAADREREAKRALKAQETANV
jgi:hypothetical protein